MVAIRNKNRNLMGIKYPNLLKIEIRVSTKNGQNNTKIIQLKISICLRGNKL